VGGLPEVVVDSETGFLHEVGDVSGMAQSGFACCEIARSTKECRPRLGRW